MKKYLSILVVLAAMVIGLTSCQQQPVVVDTVNGTTWNSTIGGTVTFNNGSYSWAGVSGKYTCAGNVVSMYVLNTVAYEFVVNGDTAVLKNIAAGTTFTFTKGSKKESGGNGLLPDGYGDIPGLDDLPGYDDIPGLDDFEW